MRKTQLVLASKSPRRQEILKAAGYNFIVYAPAFDEKTAVGGTPPELVENIAAGKAAEAAAVFRGGVIIAADTMVFCGGSAFGKPQDEKDAFTMLNKLSGVWHEVLTGYAVIKNGVLTSGCETTRVKFRELGGDEIKNYISSGEPFDKAGAYGAQGRASVFIERIEGDFYNVLGLPVCKISKIICI